MNLSAFDSAKIVNAFKSSGSYTTHSVQKFSRFIMVNTEFGYVLMGFTTDYLFPSSGPRNFTIEFFHPHDEEQCFASIDEKSDMEFLKESLTKVFGIVL